MTLGELAEILAFAAVATGSELTAEATDAYFEMFHHVNRVRFAAAVKRCVVSQPNFPRTAEIFAELRNVPRATDPSISDANRLYREVRRLRSEGKQEQAQRLIEEFDQRISKG